MSGIDPYRTQMDILVDWKRDFIKCHGYYPTINDVWNKIDELRKCEKLHDTRQRNVPEGERMFPVTAKELDQIKNDCLYPERPSCEGCECAKGVDTTRASGLGCTFKGANILMDEVLSRHPLSDMGEQRQQRVFQKQCIDCCNMRCPNQNKDIENILKCPEYLASPRPEAQPQDAAAGKAELISLSEAIGAIEKIYFRIDCYEEDVVKEEAACDALSEAMRAIEQLHTPSASSGKASDVLAELEKQVTEERDLRFKSYNASNGEMGADYKYYNTFLAMISALRQVQQP